MSLLTTAVAIANSVTLGLGVQASVIHEAFVSESGSGSIVRAPAVSRNAIVTLKQRLIRKMDGSMVQSRAQIVLLDSTLTVNVLDRFTLPDGSTGPILDIDGFVAQGGVGPILSQVYLG